MRNLLLAAFVAAFSLFFFGDAEACDPARQSCAGRVADLAAELTAKLSKGKKLATVPANCPRVDALSYGMAKKCRQEKAACRALGMSGDCTAVCAKCDVQEEFVLRWKSYCDAIGYRSPRGG